MTDSNGMKSKIFMISTINSIVVMAIKFIVADDLYFQLTYF